MSTLPANSSHVSKRLRFEILRRDNHTCRYCGGAAPDFKLTVDHVVPVALGGTNEPSNLVAACADCNSGKSATPADAAVVADVADDAMRWAKAMQLAAQTEAAVHAAVDSSVERFNDFWTAWKVNGTHEIPRDPGWRESIKHMLSQGLTSEDLERAINTAMGKGTVRSEGTWRYFCGVAWRTLEDRQKRARAIIDAGVV